MSQLYVRNVVTGEGKFVSPEELAVLKTQRTADNRFPLWEQTLAPAAPGEPGENVNAAALDARFERWGQGGE